MTNYQLDADYEEIMAARDIRYFAYAAETCPTTGREHHQCYMYFRAARKVGPRALNNIGRFFCGGGAHVEPMAGDIKDNESYCSKEGTLVELGSKPQQGARKDLDEIVAGIKDGDSVDDLVINQPMLFHQYGRTLREAEKICLRRKWRKTMTQGVWYWGASGMGKSHAAFEDFDPETHYVKDLRTGWWDGYSGQPYIVINEFRGLLGGMTRRESFSFLFELVDKWPMQLPYRNRESVPMLATTVIFTSVMHPREIYENYIEESESWAQFDRRFEIRHLVERSQKCPEGNTDTSGPIEA